MRVLVIGANGQVGRRVIKKLKDTPHQAVAMIRDEAQKPDLQAHGAETVIADLEGDISHAFANNPEVVIFTAGSGGHTGQEKTRSVDLQGAKKSIDEAKKHGAKRYLMVSALGAGQADEMPEEMKHYFVAKSEADQYLVQSNLNYTIFRPGRLTDENGAGSIQASENLENPGTRDITRDDLATALVESIDMNHLVEKKVEILEGKQPVRDALQAV